MQEKFSEEELKLINEEIERQIEKELEYPGNKIEYDVSKSGSVFGWVMLSTLAIIIGMKLILVVMSYMKLLE